MPTYEYRCNQCLTEFEVFQSIKDDPLTSCEKCNGKVQRIISKNVGIQFKGSGFYVNDSNKTSSSTGKSSKK
ncbi:FmdB family transcriptional regulator [Candidatus Marinamargulisbacteria bacterium SCGC AG-414-C22]|nr:FmdB family transcriptional regulator [Candidatus Marinamargulisbacteria bacterium SCGC AG-414-C22]